MPFCVGIDGGGSKTTVALSDGISVLASHTAGGCNLNTTSREGAQAALSEAANGVLFATGVSATSVESVCAGVAGAASPEVAATFSSILADIFPNASIEVVGDIVIALEAEFSGGSGMVCISGTGSIAFGRNSHGEFARAGGWGRLVSDEGSGNWIGQRALSQCLRALDMGRSSRLITGIMKHWHIATREQLVKQCHREPVQNFADLFPVVLDAAESADPMASEILTAAGIELARVAQVVMRRLWVGRTSLELAITGGVFTHSPHIRHVFSNFIRSDRPEVRVRISEREPCLGALYLAQQSVSVGAVG